MALNLQPPPSKKKRREQHFTSKYSEEFSFITASAHSTLHAFCKICRKDVNISHGGRGDIVQHCKTSVHARNVQLEESAKQSPSVSSFFAKPHEDNSLIKAECLFTAFFIEHRNGFVSLFNRTFVIFLTCTTIQLSQTYTFVLVSAL